MKIIALEASGGTAGCALAEDGKVLGELEMNIGKTHSQTLVPMLDALRKMTELDLHTVDAIALTAGPGSFTGLRIGAATAKGIALALEKPIIGVSTLESLAFNVLSAPQLLRDASAGTGALICPIMDARRQQVYAAVYEGTMTIRTGPSIAAAEGAGSAGDGKGNTADAEESDVEEAAAKAEESDVEETAAKAEERDTEEITADAVNAAGEGTARDGIGVCRGSVLPCLLDPCAISVEELVGELNARGREVIFLGDGVPVYRAVIDEKLAVPHCYAPGHLALQRAASTAVLAGVMYGCHGEAVLTNADDFRPVYLRKTQAEQQQEKAAATGRMAALAAGRLFKEMEAEKSVSS